MAQAQEQKMDTNTSINSPTSKLEQAFNHVALRVNLSLVSGVVLGTCIGFYRGNNTSTLIKTSISTGLTCAMTGTACFTTERIAHYTICHLSSSNNNVYNDNYNPKVALHTLLKSHIGGGGIIGGSLIGGSFKASPISGIMVLTPIMIGIAFTEHEIDEYRRQRWASFLKEISSTATDDDNDSNNADDDRLPVRNNGNQNQNLL